MSQRDSRPLRDAPIGHCAWLVRVEAPRCDIAIQYEKRLSLYINIHQLHIVKSQKQTPER